MDGDGSLDLTAGAAAPLVANCANTPSVNCLSEVNEIRENSGSYVPLAPRQATETDCSNGQDEDADSLIDCLDHQDCLLDPNCSG